MNKLNDDSIYHIIDYIETFTDFKSMRILNKFYYNLITDYWKNIKVIKIMCILQLLVSIYLDVSIVKVMVKIIIKFMQTFILYQSQFMYVAINGDVFTIV